MKIVLWIVVIVLVAVPLLGAGAFYYLGQTSQKGASPGLADGRLAPCPASPNCVSSEEGTPNDKKVDPLPAAAWALLPQVVESTGGQIVTTEADYIAATYTSKTFGFVDDVEFRRADDAVHVRSASRVGYSDRGVNRVRVAEIAALVAR